MLKELSLTVIIPPAHTVYPAVLSSCFSYFHTVDVICPEFPRQCFMIVYYLILHVNHRDTQLIVYLLPAIRHTHGHSIPCTMTPIYSVRLLTVLWAEGHKHRNGIKASEGSLRRRELYGPTPAASSHSGPPHLCVSNRLQAAQREEKTELGGSDGRGVTESLYYISVHSWVGREERAKSWQKTVRLASIHSPPPVSLCGLC